MKLIPFEKITYTSKLPIEEIKERLENEIQPKANFSFGQKSIATSKKFEGTVNGNVFQIQRIISYRNSFLPKIDITLAQDLSGSKATITFRLLPFVVIFIGFWLAIVAFSGIALAFFSNNNEDIAFAKFIPVLMVVFGYVMTILAFNYELNKAKEELEKIIQIRN
jgi:hypothetical protein